MVSPVDLFCCVRASRFIIVLTEFWRGFGAKHVSAAPTIHFVSSLLMACRCSKMKHRGVNSTITLLYVNPSGTLRSLR